MFTGDGGQSDKRKPFIQSDKQFTDKPKYDKPYEPRQYQNFPPTK